MYNIFPEPVDALRFSRIGRNMPYEVIHHDNLQSVLGLSGHDGTMLQTISYDPFGNTISTTGSSNNNQLHYTGREQDPDTGLYNYRARIYDPSIGRFCTEDPKGFAAGVNFYAYAGNNPINGNDPYGLMPPWLEGLIERAGTACEASPACAGMAEDATALISEANIKGLQWGQQAYTAASKLGQQAYDLAKQSYYTATNWVLTNPHKVGETLNKTTDIATEVLSNYTNTNQPPSASADIPSPFSYYAAAGNELIMAGAGLYQNIYNSQNNQASNPAESYLSTGSFGFSGNTSGNPAAGGYLLYPNMPNTNTMQSVYRK